MENFYNGMRQTVSGFRLRCTAIADANIEALNNVNVSHATTNQDDSIYDKANSHGWLNNLQH